MRKTNLDGAIVYTRFTPSCERFVRLMNRISLIIVLVAFLWFPYKGVCRVVFGYNSMV